MNKYLLLSIALITLFSLFFYKTGATQAQNQIWDTIVGEPKERIVDPGSGETGGSGDSGSDSGGEITFPKCSVFQDNPAKCLRDDFNVYVTGTGGYTPNDNDKKDVYNVLWKNAQSSKWRKLLMNGGQVTIAIGNGGGVSRAGISGASLPKFAILSATSQRYLLTHELGHTIGNRNRQLYNKFDSALMAKKDPKCYNYSACSSVGAGNFLKSYVLRYSCPSYGPGCITGIYHGNEAFAEATANYLTKDSVNKTGAWCAQTITNFRSTCDDTYKWMRENVFGGYVY